MRAGDQAGAQNMGCFTAWPSRVSAATRAANPAWHLVRAGLVSSSSSHSPGGSDGEIPVLDQLWWSVQAQQCGVQVLLST